MHCCAPSRTLPKTSCERLSLASSLPTSISPTRHPTQCNLQLQARAGARRNSRHLAAPRSSAIARADCQSARNPFPRHHGEPARAVCTALFAGRAHRKICRLLDQGRSEVRRPLGDGGSCRAISQGFGSARVAPGHARTTATGARTSKCLRRGGDFLPKATPRAKRAIPMPAPENCGSG